LQYLFSKKIMFYHFVKTAPKVSANFVHDEQ
jgi:hypothetical protein